MSDYSIHIGTTADLAGVRQTVKGINEVKAASEAVAQLNAALAQREFGRLTNAEKLVRLKQQEAELLRKARDLEGAGDTGGAAQLNLAALRLRERTEKLITEEKLKQNQTEREGQRNQRAGEAILERLRRDKLKDGLAQQSGAAPAPQLFGMSLDKLQGAINSLPPAVQGVAQNILGFLPELGAGAGAAGVVLGAKAIVDTSAQEAGEIKDKSEQTGLNTTEVQALGKAARKTGLDFNDFASALGNIDSQRRAAAEGNEEMRATFARFGVTLDDLQNPQLRHIDLLNKVAAAGKNASAADRVALRDLLGRRGERLGAALAEVGGIKAEDLVSPEAIARLDAYDKQMGYWAAHSKVWMMEASASWLKLGDEVGALFGRWMLGITNVLAGERELEKFNKQGAPQGQSQQEKDLKAHKLDAAAIERHELKPEDASPEYKRVEAYNKFTQDKFSASHQADDDASAADREADRIAAQKRQDEAELNELLDKRARLGVSALDSTDEGRITQLQGGLESAPVMESAYRAEAVKQRKLAKTTRREADTADKDYDGTQKILGGQAEGKAFEDKAVKAKELENTKKLAELELSMMTADERRAALKAKQAALMAEMAALPEGLEKEKKRGEAIDLEAQLQKDKPSPQTYATSADALQKMGGFVGGLATDRTVTLAEQNLAVARETKQAQQDIIGLLRGNLKVELKAP